MPSILQMPLSANERKLRIDAVAVALRRFGVTDDGSVTELFLVPAFPSQKAVARAIGQLRGLPSSVNATAIAATLMTSIASSDAKRDLLLPPSIDAPSWLVKSQTELSDIAERIINGFKHAVEHQGTWRIFWDGAKPVSEHRCQELFKYVARTWCEANNIDLSAESNIGRGPIDFKMSCGWHSRALIEVKLASSGKFWNGLSKQLPQYMTSEGIERGFFVAFVFRASEMNRIAGIEQVAAEVSSSTGYQIAAMTIDARNDNKKSASKL